MGTSWDRTWPCLLAVLGLILGYALMRRVQAWLETSKPPPDPWENEGEEAPPMDTPVCVHCQHPVASPFQHYCPKCGEVVGEYTRYLPFESIRFNYGFLGTLWRKIGNPEVVWYKQLVAMILFLAFFLVMGGPLILVFAVSLIYAAPRRWLVGRKDDGAAKGEVENSVDPGTDESRS
jgi:hypothetical protein